jgi:signal transduction histidine kinase
MTTTAPSLSTKPTIKPSLRHTRRSSNLEARAKRLEQYLATQHTISQIIATASDLKPALPRMLQAICEMGDWDFGEVWYVNRAENCLYCEATWCRPLLRIPDFEQSGQLITFARGMGLPGRTWASGKPTWIPNVVSDKTFLRSMIARRDGLRTGIAIPIHTEGEVIGALTFFSRNLRSADRELTQSLETMGSLMGLFIERKHAEQAEREREREQAAWQERQRMARDIHDSVTQTLFSASVMAEMLPRLWTNDPEQVKPGLDELHRLTRDALTEMRSLLCEVRSTPTPDNNLTNLLKKLEENITHRTNIQLHWDIRLAVTPSAEAQMTLYRIVQEALNNVMKYAAATQVLVRLDMNAEGFYLGIEDNGCGFDTSIIPEDHFGLAIMCERAASLGALFQLDSTVGKGTRICIYTPQLKTLAQG